MVMERTRRKMGIRVDQVLLMLVVMCLVFGSKGYSIFPQLETITASSPVEEKALRQTYHGKPTRATVPNVSPLPQGKPTRAIVPSGFPLPQGKPTRANVPGASPLPQGKPTTANAPSAPPLPQGLNLHPPILSPSLKSAPVPQTFERLVPSALPNPPKEVPSFEVPPLPQNGPKIVPSMQPRRSAYRRSHDSKLPAAAPNAQIPVASHPTVPRVAPSKLPDPAVPPILTPPPFISNKKPAIYLAPPPEKTHHHLSPLKKSRQKSFPPTAAPAPEKANPLKRTLDNFYMHHHAKKTARSPILAPAFNIPPPINYHGGLVVPPAPTEPSATPSVNIKKKHHHDIFKNQGPSVDPVQPPAPSTSIWDRPAPSPLSTGLSGRAKRHFIPPASPPTTSSQSSKKRRSPPVRALPPPPPNTDCLSMTCIEPETNSPSGSPCGCVWPMQVSLRLSVALYKFFPLVSEFAQEIASGVFMKQSQVRIMGANAASQQLDKTVVLIDLVPLGENFDNTTASLTFERFWRKKVVINTNSFGDYQVLYVHYPGLPSSPPSAPLSSSNIGGPYNGRGNSAAMIHPLGVDVSKNHKRGVGGSTIAIVVLSSFVVLVLCVGVTGLLLLKCGYFTDRSGPKSVAFVPSHPKKSGVTRSLLLGTGLSSASLSFGSSMTAYTGTAKTFTAEEIVRSTDNFNASRVIGEGGFGRVYKAILDDGTEVAAKVLKRDDHQGGREFLAEVEMLSRLHHRNLVKLIGICTEDHARCLIYELIHNGSVESHLHGVDKERAPLDWAARIKIALGAARGLAYLHEDSSPHVIHRDFKSSNILLEDDYIPKVSDFGLARTALDEGNKLHISTHVMGTFGYVAPEYAMTGHLLVKSDVYSYGVVLLELLTGRKPVNMLQPEGQQSLVAWARPLLTSKEGLEIIIDPALGPDVSFDSVAKVAAIASMCVQPEVSHRPFMGEVVQALKLVCSECNECDEGRQIGSSENYDREEEYCVIDADTRTNTMESRQIAAPSSSHYHEYNSSPDGDVELSTSDIFSTSVRYSRQMSGSFRRHSSSGPLRTGRSKQFWERVRGMSRGSFSEHGAAFRLGAGSG